VSIRVVQVGFGSVGQRRAALVAADPRAVLVGVCEPDAAGRASAREQYGSDLLVSETLEPLLVGDVDAVIVSTPNATHIPLSVQAVEAGAHVLCEKPLAGSLAEARPLVEAVAVRKRLFKMGANHQTFPSVLAALEQVRSGELGPLQRVRIALGHSRFEALPHWFRDPAQAGGGTLLDNGSHAALLALTLLDDAGQKPLRVSCELERRQGIDVAAQAQIIGDAGLPISLESSWVREGGYCFELQIVGRDGTLEVHNPGALSLNGVALEVVERPSWGLDTQDFLDAIAEQRAPAVDLGMALRCLALLESCYESAANGREVHWTR